MPRVTIDGITYYGGKDLRPYSDAVGSDVMNLAAIKSLYLSLHSALKDANRVYEIDPDCRLVVNMSFMVSASDTPEDLRFDPRVSVVVNSRDRRGNSEWGRADLDELNAKQLITYVELRTVVEQWIDGKLEVLPASTAKSPFENDENDRPRRRRFVG